ncbi:RNA polymerase sigma factor [Fulvivirgaceae bacterium BMA10]|uniref:RNA polymerase sigma factor n=1 Tax=Splendidivirga corallicola TaxID=3051826 RepID=A0ABT8KIH6_9BACT|nr:RNA polymerase sigma factor [Fulvivirgaceae bacterium BMA10]
MDQIFNTSDIKEADDVLIEKSLAGNKTALEDLIKKHQTWIFNVALNFIGDPDEAADITQDVLVKVVTKLGTFNRKSLFRTWVYKITKNHFLNMKRGKHESGTLTFDVFGQGLDNLKDESLSDYAYEVEEKLLVKEAKLSCMKGMLLCLDREQRLIYILGELFKFSDTLGSEVMEMTKVNFRTKLHRARTQLYNFMDDKCGLVNKKNPCRCARKTAGFIKMGYVDPKSLHFQKNTISTIEKVVEKKTDTYSSKVLNAYQQLFLDHPYLESPEALKAIKKLLSSKSIKETFNLG